MEAVVFFSPWPNVVHHEDMENKILFASMSFVILIEHWPLSSCQADEFPQENDHEDVQGYKPPISLQENPEWICPIMSIILMDLLDN